MVDDNVIDHMYADEEQREKDELLRKKLGDKEFEKQRYGIVEKDESKDNAKYPMDIKGQLTIADKIWFNDDVRCRFRMCGFSKEQIKQLEKAKFIDISIMEHLDDDIAKVKIYIVPFPKGSGSDKHCEHDKCDE